jgi:hypothetical protein
LAMVTHGVFRRALAHRLVTSGWRLSGLRRYVPWSAWTLARSGVRRGSCGLVAPVALQITVPARSRTSSSRKPCG